MPIKIFRKRCGQFTKAIRIGDDTDDSFVIVLQLLGGEVRREFQPRPAVDYHRVYAGIVLHQRRVPHAGPAHITASSVIRVYLGFMSRDVPTVKFIG